MATLLIVDDDPGSRMILKAILANLGYDTVEAADGFAAINLYRQHLPDLVLLDMIMPEKDGFETLTDLRTLNRDAGIIMMTGSRITTDLSEQLARSLRIPQVLTKPFAAGLVAKVVAEALGGRASGRGGR